MRAGELREPLTLELPNQVVDDTGGQEAASAEGLWKTVDRLWGKVESLTSRERLLAGQLDPTITRKVTIRMHSRVDSTSRFDWDSRNGRKKLYVSGAPIIDERGAQMVCLCEERSVAG